MITNYKKYKISINMLRYWAVVIGLSYELGDGWPGYRYTKQEQKDLSKLSKDISGRQIWAFLGINTTISLIIAAILVMVGMLPGIHLIAPDLSQLQFLPFALLLGSLCLIMVSIGVPVSMGISGLILNKIYPWKLKLELDENIVEHLIKKMLKQFLLMGFIGVTLSMGLAGILELYSSSPSYVLLVAVLRIIAPAITIGFISWVLGR